MLTGTELMNELVDELNELKLSTMAATLDDLYRKPGFLEMDRLTLIAELIGPQFQEKVSTTLKNRLTAAHLKGSPEELSECIDSDKREYLPSGITDVLTSLDFIGRGYNLCILGESDAGKSYLAKAIGIKACNRYNCFIQSRMSAKLRFSLNYWRNAMSSTGVRLFALNGIQAVGKP